MIDPIQLVAQSDTLRINEFMALNQTTLMDEDGQSSDWIEFYNPTSKSIDLKDWSLTVDPGHNEKWFFPQINMDPDSYLVVFASAKDRTNPEQELHTDFKLSGDGEYLALLDPQGNVATEFNPSYPKQYVDVSYGYYENEYIPFTIPTPGEANQFSEHQLLPLPVFSQERGFYESPFEVKITTNLDSAQIYYTTDGSEPSEEHGELYSDSIQINTTTALRAIIVKPDGLTSKIATQTYLFLDDIINQPNDPPGYPAEWGAYCQIPDTAIADYEMDPEITQDPAYQGLMKDALLAIPSLSIVTDKDHLFSKVEDPDSGGIYIFTGTPVGNIPGEDWERPASVEFFNADGSKEFQVDCGLRLQGGHSRLAEKSPKHSFRLVFKSQYGPSKFEYPFFGNDAAQTFNTITLRAGFCNTWHHHTSGQRNRAQLIRDTWAKDTQLAMGQISGHGNFVHLYLDGLYWGLYNPTERMDREFAASYLEGDDSDFDVIKDYAEVIDGEITAWDNMMSLARAGLTSDEVYQRIQGNNPDGTPNPEYEPYVDVVNFIDYMILNLYSGNTDWAHHNWAAVRNCINPDKGFKFLSWDAEHILEWIDQNIVDLLNFNCPTELFQKLRQNADFRRLFGDRVQLHCFNGGVLTPDAVKERWMKRANEIDLAIITESARWGDYRRDVHQHQPQGPFDLYTKNNHWLPEQSYLIDDYFPNRTNTFISQMRDANLFPSVDAPNFLINGSQITQNTITSGDVLTMTSSTGTIYYTTDGTDPYQNGNVAPTAMAYSDSIVLNHSTHVKARTHNNNKWSALNDVLFVIPSEIDNLKVTEIHYHPLPQDTIDDREFEFIELKNIKNSPLDLSGIEFCNGIFYTFSAWTILNPYEFIVLASNRIHFENRYGFAPFDEYDGNLDNGGERVVLIDATSDTLFSVRYNDRTPWPISADGQGYSLVPTVNHPTGEQNDANEWRASQKIHGSPGEDDEASTNVKANLDQKPDIFQLNQNTPNPFNPTTQITYTIPKSAFVTLKVYDIRGREIKTLVNQNQNPNRYAIHFDASNLPSGIYFYRLEVENNFIKTKKMLFVR